LPYGQAVKNPLAIAKSQQQTGIAKLLQVLRGPWLAQAQNLRQFGDAAFALRAQRHEAHAGVVTEGTKLQ
jgi:hypothetical protein